MELSSETLWDVIPESLLDSPKVTTASFTQSSCMAPAGPLNTSPNNDNLLTSAHRHSLSNSRSRVPTRTPLSNLQNKSSKKAPSGFQPLLHVSRHLGRLDRLRQSPSPGILFLGNEDASLSNQTSSMAPNIVHLDATKTESISQKQFDDSADTFECLDSLAETLQEDFSLVDQTAADKHRKLSLFMSDHSHNEERRNFKVSISRHHKSSHNKATTPLHQTQVVTGMGDEIVTTVKASIGTHVKSKSCHRRHTTRGTTHQPQQVQHSESGTLTPPRISRGTTDHSLFGTAKMSRSRPWWNVEESSFISGNSVKKSSSRPLRRSMSCPQIYREICTMTETTDCIGRSAQTSALKSDYCNPEGNSTSVTCWNCLRLEEKLSLYKGVLEAVEGFVEASKDAMKAQNDYQNVNNTTYSKLVGFYRQVAPKIIDLLGQKSDCGVQTTHSWLEECAALNKQTDFLQLENQQLEMELSELSNDHENLTTEIAQLQTRYTETEVQLSELKHFSTQVIMNRDHIRNQLREQMELQEYVEYEYSVNMSENEKRILELKDQVWKMETHARSTREHFEQTLAMDRCEADRLIRSLRYEQELMSVKLGYREAKLRELESKLGYVVHGAPWNLKDSSPPPGAAGDQLNNSAREAKSVGDLPSLSMIAEGEESCTATAAESVRDLENKVKLLEFNWRSAEDEIQKLDKWIGYIKKNVNTVADEMPEDSEHKSRLQKCFDSDDVS